MSTPPALVSSRPRRVSRRVVHAHSYGLPLRLADRIAGVRDRRFATPEGQQPAASSCTSWTERLGSTYFENDRRLLNHLQDSLREPATQLNYVTGQLDTAQQRVEQTQRDVDQLTQQEPSEEQMTRTGGEAHLPLEAIQTRRHREHTIRVQQARSYAEAARQEQRSLQEVINRLRALMQETFDMHRGISERLCHYYNRRLATYERALNVAGIALQRIEQAPWTQQPCPWMPHRPYRQSQDDPGELALEPLTHTTS